MSRHYQSSKLFNWLRKSVFKVKKPIALGWGEWGKWDASYKKEKPVAFFITETLPEWIEKIPEHSIDFVNDFRFYVQNRRCGSHRLNSNLKKGQYHEFSERMLHSLFDSYIDYIEIEEANMHVSWISKESKKYKAPWWVRIHWLRWGAKWRCPEAAIDHLKWEMHLDDPDSTTPYGSSGGYQAQQAREKMALYTWWKDIRPTRGEAWEVSGFRAFWKQMDEKYGEDWLGLGGKNLLSVKENKTYKELGDLKEQLEEQWDLEDEIMMIRLIKLRKSLWT